LLALLVDTARRLSKAGDQRRDLLRFFRHDGERDVFLRLRSMVVFHCNPPVLPRVDPASFTGSYYCQLKPVNVNRIKLDAIFDRRVLRAVIASRRLNGGVSGRSRAVMAEPTNGSHAGTIRGDRCWGAFATPPDDQRSPE
jgi:hypothetical protein